MKSPIKSQPIMADAETEYQPLVRCSRAPMCEVVTCEHFDKHLAEVLWGKHTCATHQMPCKSINRNCRCL